MRCRGTTATLVRVLMAVPLIGGAAGQPNSTWTPVDQHSSAKEVPSHAVGGVVKAVDSTRLVITRAGKEPAEMTFELRSSTQRQGAFAVGATVQVRYRTEGSSKIATAVVVDQQTGQARRLRGGERSE